MLLLMIIDEKQNHTAITMTGSMKHSILYAPVQQNFNGANVDDTTKISGNSNQKIFLNCRGGVYVIFR